MTMRWGQVAWSEATPIRTLALPEPHSLPAPSIVSVGIDNATVRWPAQPAWFDATSPTDAVVELVACSSAEPCAAIIKRNTDRFKVGVGCGYEIFRESTLTMCYPQWAQVLPWSWG